MLPLINFIFITQCLVQVVFCQRIQLFPYKQGNNCNISLVEENNRILMYGKVDFNENIPAPSVVNFEIKRKHEKSFQYFCFLKVPEDCDKVFNYCNCFKKDDHKVFKLALHITAFTVNSEADIRTELVYRETSVFSEIRHLPTVYGSKTDVVVLYANNRVVNFHQTDVLINDTQVTILATCLEKFAPECKLQATDPETGALLKSGKEMIVYNTNIKGRSNFQLKFSVCNIERNISFSITTNTTTDYLHLTTETNPILITLSTVSIVTIVLIFCFVFFVRTRQRCHARQRNKTNRKASTKLITENNSANLCFLQDTSGLNVDQTDLADFSSHGDENQDTDSHHFTHDQSRVQSDDVEGPLIGDHETQESEGGEADLHKYLVGCKKNPGHRQFIPVDTFTLKHLPEGFQHNVLYDYIKAIADLTVKVDVTMCSPHRPKFWPETTQPYPFYNMSERENLRTGTGRVWYVCMFQNVVLQDRGYGRTAYTQCKDSDSPSKVWWEFYVYTATQVVFDGIEANYTTLRLFYDRDESPVVSVDKVSVIDVNIEHDLCILKCVTFDKNLGNKLMEMDTHFQNVWKKVRNKYRDSSSQHRLTFIVSHPHGCSKQVSVGLWKDKLKIDKDKSQFTYTTCTCPGSSGAHVHCLGYYNHWTLFELVHSGSFKSGLNYSGVGIV